MMCTYRGNKRDRSTPCRRPYVTENYSCQVGSRFTYLGLIFVLLVLVYCPVTHQSQTVFDSLLASVSVDSVISLAVTP